MTRLHLCGAGNAEGVRLALNVQRAESRWDEIVLLDDDASRHGQSILGVPILGGFDLLAGADPARSEVVNLVARTTLGRSRCRARIAAMGVPFTSLVDPGVDLLGVDLKGEVVVFQGAILAAGSTLGAGSIVFMGAIVGHGSTLGEGCVLAPGAVVNARVVLGMRVYVGTNASIHPDLTVGSDATIAAGSAVFDHVPVETTAIGVPAQVLRRLEQGAGAAQQGEGAAQQGEGAAQQGAVATSEGEAEPPAELVATLCRIWERLLERPGLSAEDDFFRLGGTSRLALEMLALVQEETGIQLSPVELFRHPTVRETALRLARRSGSSGTRARIS